MVTVSVSPACNKASRTDADASDSGQAANAVPSHAAQAPAANTAAGPRGDEIPPAAKTGGENRRRNRVEDGLEEGKGADFGLAVPATLYTSGDSYIYPGIGGWLGGLHAKHLNGTHDPGIANASDLEERKHAFER